MLFYIKEVSLLKIKMVIIFILCCIMIILYTFFNIKVDSKIIFTTVELTGNINEIYNGRTDFSEFNYDSKISDYISKTILFLQSDRMISEIEIKKISYANNDNFLSLSNVSENEDTEYKIINGVRYYKLSELRKTDKVVINGSTYMYDLKSIPTYENVINSPDYSFIYEDSWVQNNIVYVKYISESEKDSIVYSVEYDIFNKIQNIDVKIGAELLCLGV